MRNFFKTSLLILTLLTLILVPFNVYAIKTPSCISDSPEVKCNFKMLERKLWIDHVLWTRSFIVSDIASLEDKNDVLHRLFKNQDDIGNSIKPYYGEEAGNKLAVLLREHIALAGKVLDAARNKNKDELNKYNKLWYDNADKIADFLSSANPNYNNKELKDMLYKHLQFVTDQVVARLNNNWKDDIESFDKGEDHIINFADIISDGIIKQFPEKFQ